MAEINEVKIKKTIQRINETESWFYEKVNKIDKPLDKLIEREREREREINTIRDEQGDNIITSTNEVQRIIREYFKS
jgi:hypothetical protein